MKTIHADSSPSMPPAWSASPTSDLRTALDAVVYDSLRPIAIGLSGLYAIFAVGHVMLLPPAIVALLTAMAVTTAAVLLSLFFLLKWWTAPVTWAHPLAGGIYLLAWGNCVLHLALVPEPQLTTNFILLTIGGGLFLLSVRWLVLLLAVTWMSWGAIVWGAPPVLAWTHFGFAFLIATVLGVLVHTVRLRAFSRLELIRLQSEREREALARAVQAAQQSEERFRLVTETTSDAIYDWDFKAGAIWRSEGYMRLLQPPSPVGRRETWWETHLHSDDRERTRASLRAALARRDRVWASEYRFRRDDGAEIFLTDHALVVYDDTGAPLRMVGAITDVTARTRAEEEGRRYAERLSMLHEIDHAMQMARSPEAIAHAALPRLRRLVPCQRASVALLDWNAWESILLAIDGDLNPTLSFMRNNRLPFAMHPHLEAAAFQQGQSLIETDLDALSEAPPLFQAIRAVGVRSYMSVPLRVREELIGAIHMASEEPGAFSAEHQEIIREVAASLAVAIHQARLYEQVQRQAEELEYKVAERTAELQERQRFIEQITNTTPTILYLCDLTTYCITYVNRQVETILGYFPESVTREGATPVLAFIHPEDTARVAERFQHYLLAKDGEVFVLEYRISHCDGQWRWLRDQGTVFARTEDGAPRQVLGSAQDITERKEAEEALRQAKEVAEAANRAKSEFLATMSHELRTPLHIIVGYVDLLCEEAFGPLMVQQSEILQRVRQKSRELHELISAVLDLSAMEAGRMRIHIQEMQVSAVLKELEAEFRELQEQSDLTWIWRSDPLLPSVSTDLSKLKIVIKNLVSNAAKFTSSGSILVAARDCNGGVEVSVTDTGVGIPREALQAIFAPFHQLDSSDTRQYEGSGLGLHIVKRLLELLGGDVTVESEVGRGSTFRVWIPQHTDRRPSPLGWEIIDSPKIENLS